LRNVFITLSCIKLGNIPEKSLTQAHQCLRSPHNQQRQGIIEQRGKQQTVKTRNSTAKRFSSTRSSRSKRRVANDGDLNVALQHDEVAV
jgi:hypothetical protein